MEVAGYRYNTYDDLEKILVTDNENCMFYRVSDYDGKIIVEVDAKKRLFDKKCYEWSSKKVLEDIKKRTRNRIKKMKIVKDIDVKSIVTINVYIGYFNEKNNINDILVKLYYDKTSTFDWLNK